MLMILDEQKIKNCTKCPSLCKERTKTVFGEGDHNSKVMFIGEAPGAQENKAGRPFVGPAGQLLDGMINASGWERKDVFIANLLKCQPPANRRPSHTELENCSPYLDLQIKIVNPKYIVCLGATAAHQILGKESTWLSITQLRGRPHNLQDRKVICTYHPSYVLQAADSKADEIKRMIWDDLQLLLKEIKINENHQKGTPAERLG